jgi:hypothetical protein
MLVTERAMPKNAEFTNWRTLAQIRKKQGKWDVVRQGAVWQGIQNI